MLHPAIELRYINDHLGYGVFARENIPRGTITWALDPLDQVFDAARTATVEEPLRSELTRYSWVTGKGERILCWDFGRFMNHSCDPNSAGPGLMELELALRDIAAGEEVTCDYGTFNLEQAMDCACGFPGCRGTVDARDVGAIAPLLDERVRAAFGDLDQVAQPLWHLVKKWQLQLERARARPAHLPSLADNRWPRQAPGRASRLQARG